jgi:hypothetical protein
MSVAVLEWHDDTTLCHNVRGEKTSASHRSCRDLAIVAARLLFPVPCRLRDQYLHEDAKCHTLPCAYCGPLNRTTYRLHSDARLRASICHHHGPAGAMS